MSVPTFVTVGDAATVDSGPAFKSAHFGEQGAGIRLLRGDNIEPGSLRWTRTKTWPLELLGGYEHLAVREGDLILGMDRPVISTGLKLAQVTKADLPALLVQRVARIRPHNIDGRYLYYWLTSEEFIRHLQGSATGTQLPHVTLTSIREFRVPRFGVESEHCIVDLLEDHLSRLDAAESYLKSAEARETVLYRRLLDAALMNVATVTVPFSSTLKSGLANGRSVPTQTGGFPVLRLTALREGRIDLNARKEGAWTQSDASRFLVERGDFLISRGNGSLRLVGLGGLVTDEPDPVAYPDTLIRARPDGAQLDAEYLALIWNSSVVRRQVEASAKTTAGIYKVNQKDLGAVNIPMTSLAQQATVVASVRESRDALAVVAKGRVRALARLSVLRRSLLAAAFSGRLTAPQAGLSLPDDRNLGDRKGMDVE